MESLRDITQVMFTAVGGTYRWTVSFLPGWGTPRPALVETDGVEYNVGGEYEGFTLIVEIVREVPPVEDELARAQAEAEEEIARVNAIGDALSMPGEITEEDEVELAAFMASELDGEDPEGVAAFEALLAAEERRRQIVRDLSRKSALFNLAGRKILICHAILSRLQLDDATQERVRQKIQRLQSVRGRLQT